MINLLPDDPADTIGFGEDDGDEEVAAAAAASGLKYESIEAGETPLRAAAVAAADNWSNPGAPPKTGPRPAPPDFRS